MDSLSQQDATFLYVENECRHMHIALVTIFEGPSPVEGEIEAMIASKLHHIPRYRQKVQFVPLDLGHPVWVDDPDFELNYHVRHTALASPGNEEQLNTLVGRIMSQKLDRDRPLWELWVVEGLEGNQWALVSKTHHCLVDGVSGSALVAVLLDATPDMEHPPPVPWQPATATSSLSLAAGSLLEGFRKPQLGLQALRRVASKPLQSIREVAQFAEGFSIFRDHSASDLETSLNGEIGPHRRWHRTSTSIETIRKIRGAHGGTINDVVLTAVASGFRSLLLSRGEPVDGLYVRTLVPVSVRREEERGELNNRVAVVFIDLPMEISDPVERLSAIRSSMDSAKEHHQAEASESLLALTELTPSALLALGTRFFADLEQHFIQTVVTNVPGPRQPLFAAGRRMLHAYPYVPLSGSIKISTAVFSYAGAIQIGITGDYEGASDIDILAAGIDSGIAELLEAS